MVSGFLNSKGNLGRNPLVLFVFHKIVLNNFLLKVTFPQEPGQRLKRKAAVGNKKGKKK